MKKTIAIILAAGMGERMGVITKDKPKVLVEVGGKTLLNHAITFIKQCNINDIIVVGGYCFNKVEEEVKKINPTIKLVENLNYELQNLTSLSKALSLLDDEDDVLICNSDYVFKKTTARAVAHNMKEISVYCSSDLSGDDDDVMKTKADSQGNLVEMSKKLEDFDSIYTGIFFFAAQYIPKLKKITAEILKNYDNKKTTVEYLFTEFIKNNHQIKVQNVGKADWLEIDTPEELVAAKQALNKKYE